MKVNIKYIKIIYKPSFGTAFFMHIVEQYIFIWRILWKDLS